MGLAQVKPKDYKGIGTVSFYGVVYEGTKIVASDRPFEDFVSLFRSTNDYLAQSKSNLAKAIKRTFNLQLQDVDVQYAINRNSSIDELSLFVYKAHSSSCSYQQLQDKLNAMHIPPGDGYGLVMFSYLIDYSAKEYEYDIVFFNRQSMRIIAHNQSESEDAYKDKVEEFRKSVFTALNEYNFR